jgi:hypothetical protein
MISCTHAPRDGCGGHESCLQDETGHDQPLHQKNERVRLGREEALWSNVAPSSASPQGQPTAHTKEKDLDRIEHPLHKRYTGFTGKNHR